VATEAAWLKGKQFGKRRNKEKKENNKNERKALTLTGLLMEGVCHANSQEEDVVLGFSGQRIR